jgi:hypothetical protein
MSISTVSYFRVSNDGSTYFSEVCNYNTKTRKTTCTLARQFIINDTILTYDTFETTISGVVVRMFAYVNSSKLNIVQFEPLDNYNGTFNSISID